MLIIGLLAVTCAEAFLRIGRAAIMGWVGTRFVHRLGVGALDSILDADILSFSKEAMGGYLERFQSIEALREFYSGQSALVVVDLPFVAVYLALIAVIAGWLVAIPIVLLGVAILLAVVMGRWLRTAIADRTKTDDQRNNFIIEALTGVHTVKSMALEPQMQRRYERLQGTSAEKIARLSTITSINQGLGNMLSQISMVAVVSIGSLYVITGDLTMGALAATTMLTGRTIQPVTRAMSIWTQYQRTRLSYERLGGILDLPSDIPVGAKKISALRGAIALENVGFTFPGSDKPLFSNVNLSIEQGETIGIIGDNGVGKSTLLMLLAGILKPTTGRILYDGRDVAGIDPRSLAREIGFMPQRAAVFGGTLLENLTMFRRGDAIEEAVEIVNGVGLHSFVTSMPQGLDTRLAESVVETLPDGVKQRIGVVRALIGSPPVILFDDANAGLDYAADTALRGLLADIRGRQTMVLVSFRPSLQRLCDKVWRLTDEGLTPVKLPDNPAAQPVAQPSVHQRPNTVAA
ncbi:MAG: ABC transporter transmembrane domain-containing protein [Pseudomonadota bacterium]